MKYYTKCSNYASDTCPCELAEEGKCIVCSMNRGESTCDCTDTVSYCIEQELINNGGKAKAHRPDIEGKITYVREFRDELKFIRFVVPDITPFMNRDVGTYVFMRLNSSTFYDVPLSVMYDDINVNTLAVLIKIRGVKTSKFKDLKVGDRITLRGPYYNGVMGRRDIAGFNNSKAYVFCKGIGFMPSIHVIEDLRRNNNEVKIYIDSGDFDNRLIYLIKKLYDMEVNEFKACDESGDLTEEYRDILGEMLSDGCKLIHMGLSNYLIKKSIRELERIGYNSRITFINNAKLCCGEGVCGACTKDIGANHSVHLCKKQLEIDEIKKLVLE